MCFLMGDHEQEIPEKSQMIDVSVIIINYNTLAVTANCIDSVFERTAGITFEVILVDNASSDGSKEYFSSDKRIKYIYNDSNLGFGQANNLGLSVARGRNILFLNPDTLLVGNPIKTLSEHLDSHENTGACGGNLYDASMKPVISYERQFPSIFSEADRCFKGYLTRLLYGRNRKFNHTGKDMEVAYIVGADLMVKSSVLNRTGGFDKRFFMYYEEVELCHRIHGLGYKVMNVPSAEIKHLEGISSKMKDPVSGSIRNETMRLSGRKTYFDIVHSKIYHRIANHIRLIYFYSRLAVVKDKDALTILRTTLENFKELYKK